MKHLFAALLISLLAASAFTAWLTPELSSDVPVLYVPWDLDRQSEIDDFHKWLVANGFTKPGDPTKPCMELRIHASSKTGADALDYKQLIEGVSGVGSDLMSFSNRRGDVRYFNDCNLLRDLTADSTAIVSKTTGRPLHFDPSTTWEPTRAEISLIDADEHVRQYLYPTFVYVNLLWVDKDAFTKYNLTPPPKRMSFEEFERRGVEFVQAANRRKARRDTYFLNEVTTLVLFRSKGLGHFNETLTRCILDDPRFAETLEQKKRWIYDLHIMPTPGEIAAFAVDGKAGDSVTQPFYTRNYAMVHMDRAGWYTLRKFRAEERAAGRRPRDLNIEIIEPPNDGFPNALAGGAGLAIYKGSKHPELARLFLAYLASKEYNQSRVKSSEGLPPNPAFCQGDDFKNPPDYPWESGCHEPFATGLSEIGVGAEFCPFILPTDVNRFLGKAEESFMSGRVSAQDAGDILAKRINDEMQRRIAEQPSLRKLYDDLCARQKQIDVMLAPWKEIDRLQKANLPVQHELRAAAKPIPAAMIENTYYRRYYASKGWLKTDVEAK